MIKLQKLETRAKAMTKKMDKSYTVLSNINKNQGYFIIPLVILLSLAMSMQSAFGDTTPVVTEDVVKIKKSSFTLAEVSKAKADPTPFGVDLDTVVIVNERVFGKTIKDRNGASGIDTSSAGTFKDGNKLERRLNRFLDRPLSFELIEEVKIEVINYYRQNQLKLMSVSVPPQEISDGGLQINVLPFVLGEVFISGNKLYPTDYIRKNIRAVSGNPVDTNELVVDLDWLSQNPFRNIQGSFKAGNEYGTTDVHLNVSEDRPYAFIVGASNSGSTATSKERIFGGFSAVGLARYDDVFTYTGMIDPVNLSKGQLLDIHSRKGFLSHTFNYASPLDLGGLRSKFNVQAQFLSTIAQNATINMIQGHSRTQVYSSEISFPQRKWVGTVSLTPELYGRVEVKRSSSDTLLRFKRMAGATKTASLTQFPIGVRGSTNGKLFGLVSQGNVDGSLVIGRANKGGVRQATYSYFGYTVNQNLILPSDFILAFSSHGQYTRNSLPALSQAGIGGDGSVRGYEASEISTEKGVVMNFALKMNNVATQLGDLTLSSSPYAFYDIGYAGALGNRGSKVISSGGIGADVSMGSSTVFKASLARAFQHGVITKSESLRAHFNIVSRF